MEKEIDLLRQTIASAPETTPEIVDALNQLAVLQLETDGTASSETSEKAIAAANAINYQAGEAQALLNAGMAAAKRKNHTLAGDYYCRSLLIWEILQNEKGMGDAHARLGNTHLYGGKYDEALEHYQVAINIRTNLNDDTGTAELINNIGNIYLLQGNHTLALKSLLKSLKTFELSGNSMRVAGSSSNIGIIYKEQQNYAEALKMFQNALGIYRQANSPKDISKTLNNIGNVYQEQQNFAGAIEIHNQALQLREQMADKANMAVLCQNLGNAYKDLGQLAVALSFYTRALSFYNELHDKRDLLLLYIDLGELYFKMDNGDQAHNYLNKAMKLAEETGLKNPLRKAFEVFSMLFAREKNYEEAYKFHLRYMQLDKEIANVETSRQIAQMTMTNQLEQKEREAELQRVKNAELQKAYASLEEEKKRSEILLNNILPEEVSEELKQSGKTKARSFNSVTVMFADIRNFTRISEQLSAEELVSGLDEYFELFDKIVDDYGVEKIKTIGDAYLCAAGVPVPTADHACKMVQVAQAFLLSAKVLDAQRSMRGKHTFDFRIGIHSGPLVAGVVGIKKFAYDIWGDTVNTASRLQQNSEPNQINISESTYQLVKEKFDCVYRGEIEAKNKGKLKMYFIE